MICPQCGEREDYGHYVGVNLGSAGTRVDGVHCRVCGYTANAIDDISKAVDEGKSPQTVGELLEVTKGPGLLDPVRDELPGIKKALEQGDMDYVTDERTEWLVIEVELARAVIAAVRHVVMLDGLRFKADNDPKLLEVALQTYDALRVPISE